MSSWTRKTVRSTSRSWYGADPAPPLTQSRARLGVVDDEALLARAESALTEIKIAHGLSEEHASVLAALRIRLKGKADASLEELMESAGDLGVPTEAGSQTGVRARANRALDDALARPDSKRSLDDVLAEQEKPKPDWPS